MKKTITIFIMIFMISSFAFSIDHEAIKNLQSLGFEILEKNTKAINIELENLKGKTVSLDSYKGKIVFLNFWATWCPPCRAEMPSMNTLLEKYDEQGLKILAVNLREDKKTVKKFIKKNGYNFDVILDKEGKAGYNYQVQAIPTTYIVDKEGFLVAKLTGSIHWDTEDVYSVFDKLLK